MNKIDSLLSVIELFLPENTLDWFDVVDGNKIDNEIRIVLEEKNIPPLPTWYQDEKIESIILAADALVRHKETILNYFINRNTNASTESFNAKLKGFRAVVRGIRDKKFYLYRVTKLYG